MYNWVFFQRSEFRNIGTLIAMSITQGGHGFPVLHHTVYQYMVTGSYLNDDIDVNDIPHTGVRVLVEEVCDGMSNDSCIITKYSL